MNKNKKSYVHDLHLLFFYNQNNVLFHLLFNLPFCGPKKTHQLFFNVVSLISTKCCFHLPLQNSSHPKISLLWFSFFWEKNIEANFFIFPLSKNNSSVLLKWIDSCLFYNFDTAGRWTGSPIICYPKSFWFPHLRSFRYDRNCFFKHCFSLFSSISKFFCWNLVSVRLTKL